MQHLASLEAFRVRFSGLWRCVVLW